MPASAVRAAPERLAFHLEAAGRPFDAAVACRRASADAIRRARHREAQAPRPAGPAAARRARARRPARRRGHPAAGPHQPRRRRCRRRSHGSDELLAVVAEARRVRRRPRRHRQAACCSTSWRSATCTSVGEFVAATDVAAGVRRRDRGRRATRCRRRSPASSSGPPSSGAAIWSGGTASSSWRPTMWQRPGRPGAIVGARAVGAMWSLLGLAACVRRPARRGRRGCSPGPATSSPTEDGYGRCLVAATAAMADQLADRPAPCGRRSSRCGRWPMDLGQRLLVRLGAGAARLGGRRRGRGDRAGDDGRDGRREPDAPDHAVLPVPARLAALRARPPRRRAWPASTTASPSPRRPASAVGRRCSS